MFVEPMGAPSDTNARNYASDYYVVITPGTNSRLKMELIRHAYLHYLLDPTIGKFSGNLGKIDPLMEAVKLAPMDENFKEDPSLLVTECVIRAVEARTLSGGKAAQAEQDRDVEESMEQGFILTRYFYERLVQVEKESVGFKGAFPAMLASIDVRAERRRTAQIQFAGTAEPELLHLSRPTEGQLLVTAEERLSAGEAAPAGENPEKELPPKNQEPRRGRVFFLPIAPPIEQGCERAH